MDTIITPIAGLILLAGALGMYMIIIGLLVAPYVISIAIARWASRRNRS